MFELLFTLALMFGGSESQPGIIVQPVTCYRVFACGIDGNGNEILCIEIVDCELEK